MPDGEIDRAKVEARFTLAFGDGKQIDCVAKIGVLEQITAALSRLCGELRVGPVHSEAAAEMVAGAVVRFEPMHEVVILRLLTDRNVAHNFAMGRDAARDISDQLKSESERDPVTGRT